MKQALSLTRKELDTYFSSPMALIFVGVFLLSALFTFFWVDSFFARGIADVRALFIWLPVLLIFLVAALTMRQWSEEEQTGTLQVLLTLPIRMPMLVLGKFLAVLALVAVALAFTLFLPITVSSLGNLDWGPVIGGYIAALLMASTYIAIGLFISSRTDNQIVALILTVLVCGFLQIIGTTAITSLFTASVAEILRALSTASRFESIQRGVIDLRDLVYYLSLTIFFLSLNVISLDSKRWSTGEALRSYRSNAILLATLIALNLIAFNLLLARASVRLDLTQGQEYTLSSTTRELLANLQEPLLIRGYFSEENHPFLAPLIPQVRDLLEEYQIASNGRMQVEFVDPLRDPELEREANQVYGITPRPLQVADRGGVSVLNIYFDLLIRYGDQSTTVNFSDLIEVSETSAGLDVRLRNLEYDLTSRIQRSVYGFQSIESILASLSEPARLTLYVTPGTLPAELVDAPAVIETIALDIAATTGGRLAYQVVDMSVSPAPVDPQQLRDRYQIEPIATNFFATEAFYLHMVIEANDKVQVIFPSGNFSQSAIRSAIESALKRSAEGFLKVVGLWTPPSTPQTDMFGQQMPILQSYNTITASLRDNYDVRTVTLSNGDVPPDIDVLVVVAPKNMTDIERYAIDQYLMRGGSVFVAAGNYELTLDAFTGNLGVQPVEAGLQDMLAHYGVRVGSAYVMDPQNEPFPIQTQRDLGGGVVINEVQAVSYPPFVDVRSNQMDRNSTVVATLSAVTLNWPSPVVVDASLADNTTVLLSSSSQSWLTNNTNAQPDPRLYPEYGFPVEGERTVYPLAVAIEGQFTSYFVGRPNPFESTESEEQQVVPSRIGLIESSPSGTRLIVVGSGEFLNDIIFQISRNLSGERYFNSLQMLNNAVDWFDEDASLAAIRSRGTAARVLQPLNDAERVQWEGLNYALAIGAVIAMGVIWRWRKQGEKPFVFPARAVPQSATMQEEA